MLWGGGVGVFACFYTETSIQQKISVNFLHHSLWAHKRFMDKTHTWQRKLYGQAKEQEISFRKHLRILGISSDKEMQTLLKILTRNHRQIHKLPQNAWAPHLGGRDLLDSET